MTKKRFLIALSALLIFGLVAGVFAYNRTNNKSVETSATSCPLMNKQAASSVEKDSCGMADCCKDGACSMGGACCGDKDSCPMKGESKSANHTASTDEAAANGESCCYKGAACCNGGACCAKRKS